ncbi:MULTISPECIES: site-specific integrase [Cupriavidus]
MAMVRARGAKFELRVKHKLLPRPYTATFETEAEAREYGNQLEAMLAQGLIPREAVSQPKASAGTTVGRLAREYLDAVSVSVLDRGLLDLLVLSIGAKRLVDVLQYKWVEEWVRSLKLVENLAPGTIRKRVGCLARMLDWHLKREAADGGQPLANPLRLLPKNYSTYNERERILLAADKEKVVKIDVERRRRLLDGEEDRILAAMNGQKREDRERPLLMPEREAMIDLFDLVASTGLRLREAYRLRPEHVLLDLWTIHVADSKTGAARDVPILPALHGMLERRLRAARLRGPGAMIFPWWDGVDDSDKVLNRVTSRLSRAFGRVFRYAGCEDLTEHDLRHEATCRWVLLRDGAGGWMYRGEEVMKITGHKDPRVFMRYLSLRGSDLADRLWVKPPLERSA